MTRVSSAAMNVLVTVNPLTIDRASATYMDQVKQWLSAYHQLIAAHDALIVENREQRDVLSDCKDAMQRALRRLHGADVSATELGGELTGLIVRVQEEFLR